ncbi:MAG TPA: hypothetical protein VGN86_02510 [Pyrinomonadaceae bacterium]|jgi:hypothetical protein|nr:hypothetical protein [Pyrinomonadaceae bacterium]
MLRKLILTILIVISVVAALPIADSAARGLSRSLGMSRHHRWHSRRWWRRHHARVRRMKTTRALAHKPVSLKVKPAEMSPAVTPIAAAPVVAVTQLENGWNRLPAAANGELKFRAVANPTDQAKLSVVALSRPNPAYLTQKEQKQMLSGVSFSELRRTVIDKMIAAGGWVSNDYERDVNGRRVFVVSAQTPGDGRSPDKAWNFYFTEVNGRIYSLTTEANVQSAERMAAEAERFIASLQ